jgi:hypothetical protein
MVIKHTADTVDICTEARNRHLQNVEDGRVVYDRHRRAVTGKRGLRILQPGGLLAMKVPSASL